MTQPLLVEELPPETFEIPTASRKPTVVAEMGIALLVFLVFCIVALSKASSLLEPDDFAYRASIVALSHGWILLTNAQHTALLEQLRHFNPSGISQWDHLSSGYWISEKNPGYPFLAEPFYALGVLRVAPLFYGLLGCVGLFAGARAWLGRWAGTYAVILFCFSGAAMAFAWRSTMPSFTDASLIAAGAGALLWSMVSVDSPTSHRTFVGVMAFVALDLAVFTRYTNIAVLIVAVVAVAACLRSAKVAASSALWWAGTVVGFGAFLAVFNATVYGGPTKTGYAAGEITFSGAAIVPNLEHMPLLLIRNIPACILATVSLNWMVVAAFKTRSSMGSTRRVEARRNLAVGASLATAWLSVWGLYVAYDWTARMSADPSQAIHVIRFYVPVLGVIALLGTYVLTRIPLWGSAIVLALVVGLSLNQFNSLASAQSPRGGFPGGFGTPGDHPPTGKPGSQFGGHPSSPFAHSGSLPTPPARSGSSKSGTTPSLPQHATNPAGGVPDSHQPEGGFPDGGQPDGGFPDGGPGGSDGGHDH